MRSGSVTPPAEQGIEMRVFGHLPFKWKLTLVLMTTSVVSLLLGCAAFLWYDNYLFRQSMIRDVETLANSISIGTQAAMANRDRDLVNRTLAALKGREQIVAAAVFDADETPLGSYLKNGETIPPRPSRLQSSFEGDYVAIFRTVNSAQGKGKIGTVYLKADVANQLWGRSNRYANIM